MRAGFKAPPPGDHPSDHELDLFVLGQLFPDDRARIREHLLVCDACCLNVVDTAEFIEALRAQLRGFEPP